MTFGKQEPFGAVGRSTPLLACILVRLLPRTMYRILMWQDFHIDMTFKLREVKRCGLGRAIGDYLDTPRLKQRMVFGPQ
ncbi:hypothetical protein ASF98_18750 [Arthrobacter sp. Leaf337]|nr:hypothetical protein ASF98_18750 [Arthrobacter sp. Leaf337]